MFLVSFQLLSIHFQGPRSATGAWSRSCLRHQLAHWSLHRHHRRSPLPFAFLSFEAFELLNLVFLISHWPLEGLLLMAYLRWSLLSFQISNECFRSLQCVPWTCFLSTVFAFWWLGWSDFLLRLASIYQSQYLPSKLNQASGKGPRFYFKALLSQVHLTSHAFEVILRTRLCTIRRACRSQSFPPLSSLLEGSVRTGCLISEAQSLCRLGIHKGRLTPCAFKHRKGLFSPLLLIRGLPEKESLSAASQFPSWYSAAFMSSPG